MQPESVRDRVISIAKGAALAAVGAAAVYLANAIGTMNYGVYTPVVMAAFSLLANVLRKFHPELYDLLTRLVSRPSKPDPNVVERMMNPRTFE